jgi:sec-independent protein translocase protein TatB
MEFLGIGPLELFFIVVIALIVLGPKDMVKAGRTLGRWLRNVVTSPSYRTVQQVSNELRNLPNRLMREAGFDENGVPITEQIRQELGMNEIQETMRGVQDDLNTTTSDLNNTIQKTNQDLKSTVPDWTTPPANQSGISDWITPPKANSTPSGNGSERTEAASENPANPVPPSETIIPGPPPPATPETIPSNPPSSPENPPSSVQN